jgi:molybdenum transport protein
MSTGLMLDSGAYRLPDEEIDRFLREDCPYGDLTTTLLQIGTVQGRMSFTTRDETVVCCTEEAARLLQGLGCTVTAAEPSGTLLTADRTLLEVCGQAGSLHTGWKAAVNLLEAASGIATRTHALVQSGRAANPTVEVVATRKVFPGTKAVATKAVYAGGGLPHRLGLSESVLVFAQHLVFLENTKDLWVRLREIKQRAKGKKVGIEVTDQIGALAAALAGVDMIQVDKMGFDALRRLLPLLREVAPKTLIAAAGGITEHNAGEYAATGVDLLVTSAMYWGKPADIAVTMEMTG